MGILNRLWFKVWQSEEDKKSVEANQILNEASLKAAKIRAQKTPIQEMAMYHGGPEPSPAEFAWQQVQAVKNQKYQNMMLQQAQAIGTGGLYGSSSQSNLGAGNWIYQPQPITATGNLILNTANTRVWPVFGSSDRDTFFMALKGIEEASMGKPDGNHRYDDLAFSIMDLRYFDPKRISLLGLISFCLSNLMEVEPLVVLLEGHGMTVVDE